MRSTAVRPIRLPRRLTTQLVPMVTLALFAGPLTGAAGAATAARHGQLTQITAPGGLRPRQAAARTGDCELSNVTCRPSRNGSCTGNTSQSTPPASIKVLLRGSGNAVSITTVPFETYVENVLPDEWVPSWDGDALKAGAIAVKSYAWYWATHFGGYVNGDPTQCFDVADDQDFQVYQANSATARTTRAVQSTWAYVARVNGQVLQTSYRAYFSSTNESCGAGANGTTLSQWGSQNCVEASTGNKWNVILAKYYSGVELATTRQRRTPRDFTYAQRSTPVIFRPSNNRWYIADGYPTVLQFGAAGDIPAVTDNGDGFAHVGVFRPSTGYWYQAGPTGAIVRKTLYGQRGDVPVPAHYAGSAAPSVLSVFRPSTGQWFISGEPTAVYGRQGDLPVPGHYLTVDGPDTRSVYRPSTGQWFVQGQPTVVWGRPGDVPAPADYNGDGTTDIAVYRPSSGEWWVRGSAVVTWGKRGDLPLIGDYTGDGRADFAVYRPSTHQFYVRGEAPVTWGVAGDKPIGQAPTSQ